MGQPRPAHSKRQLNGKVRRQKWRQDDGRYAIGPEPDGAAVAAMARMLRRTSMRMLRSWTRKRQSGVTGGMIEMNQAQTEGPVKNAKARLAAEKTNTSADQS